MKSKRIVGIGIGPSNLALAIALLEKGAAEESLFFDQENKHTIWHSGMMLDHSMLQLSFLKDLVTLRNPMSPFSFVNYLKVKGRLNQFINAKNSAPTRIEYSDYLNWVKEELPSEMLQFTKRVTRVAPVFTSDQQTFHQLAIEYVDADDPSDVETVVTDNLVIACGRTLYIPEQYQPLLGAQVFHSSEFKQKIHQFEAEASLRVGVIGAGQSAGEIVDYLHNRFPNSEIYPIFRGAAYKPSDSTPFMNEIFDPQQVDFFYHMEDEVRERVLQEFNETNYSRVNQNLLTTLYQKMYLDKVLGRERIHFLNYTEIEAVERRDDQLRLTARNRLDQHEQQLDFDVLVLCTGYKRSALPAFLSELQPYLVYHNGQPSISRSYRLHATDDCRVGLYLQGQSEYAHGISDTLLSVLPIRVEEIAAAILTHNPSSQEVYTV